jgi:TonB family protein
MRSLITLVFFACSAAWTQPRGPAEPLLVQRVEPEYTAEARAAGLQGLVTVYLEVDDQGRPDNVALLQGLGLGLDEKAVAAVRQWRFQPPLQGAPRIAEAVDVPFRLDSGRGWRIRQAAYAVIREDEYRSEPVVRPVLTQYTPPAAAACVEGEAPVRLEIRIGKDGHPSQVSIPDARDDAMARAVVEAANSWSFRQALGAGQPRAADGSFLLECGLVSHALFPPPPALIGRGVSAPVLVWKVEPEYSEEARKNKFQGTVKIRLEVDAEGIPINLRISPMLGEGLDFNAMQAVKRWRFQPGTKDGTPVRVIATLEVNFRLL